MVITAYGTIEKAVEAMKLGAADFITKPFSSEEFGVKIDRLLADRAERLRLKQGERGPPGGEHLPARGEAEARYGEIVGESPQMRDVFRWIDRVARSDSTVMIYGESGTGKELVARAIHAGSPRKDGPFIRVNCGALTEGLLDSELFGHEKGAFTGAERKRRGRFELANGGTLFLDEIATVPTPPRSVFFGFSRRGSWSGWAVRRPFRSTFGSSPPPTPRRPSCRREETFGRIFSTGSMLFPSPSPPSESGRSDVPVLVNHFLGKLKERTNARVSGVSEGALQCLMDYEWPGNVRELENIMERALVLAEGEVLQADDLPFLPPGEGPDTTLPESSFPVAGLDLNQAVEGVEERLLRKALEQAKGVKAEAARLLGIKASALYYKLEKYGIEG